MSEENVRVSRREVSPPFLHKPSPWGEGGWPKARRMRGQISLPRRARRPGAPSCRVSPCGASDFARGGKVTKTPPGTAPDEHFVLIVAFPRTPITGVAPWAGQKPSGAQNLSGFPQFNPGHWALSLQKFQSVRFQFCAWLCRTNAPGAGYAVGATLAVARDGCGIRFWFPL